MGIEFERGAFENPEEPLDQDNVDSSIVVVVVDRDRNAAHAALERSIERWRGIDGAGRHHDRDDDAFWDPGRDYYGVDSHTAKWFSSVDVTPAGIELYVDAQSLMPAPMRRAYRRVLVEELEAAGIRDAVVRSQHADHYGPAVEHDLLWPPYQDAAVLCLPPGVPPGQVLRQELHPRRGLWNPMQAGQFDGGWEATAFSATSGTGETAVHETVKSWDAAGWRIGEPAVRVDPDGKQFLFAQVAMERAAGFVACQDVAHIHAHHLAVPAQGPRMSWAWRLLRGR